MSHLLIVDAPYYTDISALLVAGATTELDKHGHSHEYIKVPGAFEIPAVISLALANGRYDGYIALGCVIRGETTHYDHVAQESLHGLTQLAITQHAAIGSGILTVENKQQAIERAEPAKGNKGAFAANAAITMIDLKRRFGGSLR